MPATNRWWATGTETAAIASAFTTRRPLTFYLRNTNCLQGPNDHGDADIVFNYGPANSGMLPLAGDWDGSGKDGIGLYSPFTSTFYLRETTRLQGPSDKGYADAMLNYGVPGMGFLPIAGDWNGDGKDGIGLYDQAISTFFLRNAIQRQGPSDKGYADLTFTYGEPNVWQLPVAGDWTGEVISVQSPTAGGTTEISTGTSFASGRVVARESSPTGNSPNAPAAINGLAVTAATQLQPAQLAFGAVLGGTLNTAEGSVVHLGDDAAGNGAIVDSPAGSDEELTSIGDTPRLPAIDPGATDRIDLATVAEQELRHLAGANDVDALADDIVGGVPGAGIRRTAMRIYACADVLQRSCGEFRRCWRPCPRHGLPPS